MWISSKEYRNLYHISSQQLYQLVKRNKVNVKQISDKKYLYEADDNLLKRNNKIVIYARVSTSKQKEDLERQIKFLKEYCVSNGYIVSDVYSDIGSGMNETRKHFNNLLEQVKDNQIKKIVISNKDRLTRFGFGYIETFCSMSNTEIEVVNLDSEKTFQEELSEDLIAIIHYFSMRFYGKRKSKLNEFEKSLKDAKDTEINTI